MKRFGVVAALCLLITLTACSQISAKPSSEPQKSGFFDFFNDAAVSEFADNFDTDRPVSVSYTFNGEASGEPVISTDPNDIAAAFQALKEILVADKVDVRSTDNEHIFSFVLQDGSKLSFCFNGHNLEYGGEVYTIEKDSALWRLTSRLTNLSTS